MSWCKLELSLSVHPKIGRLATSLDISRTEAMGVVTTLWCWTGQVRPSGDLSGLTSDDINKSVPWDIRGDPRDVCAGLIGAGFIDFVHDPLNNLVMVIHGWEERAEGYRRARKESERRKGEQKSDVGKNRATLCTTRAPRVPHDAPRVPHACPTRACERRGEEKRRDQITSEDRSDLVILPPQDDAQIEFFQTEGKPQEPVSLSVTQVIDLWNATTSGVFPYARPGVTTSTRRRHIAARLAQPDRDAAWWEALFRRMMASDFLRGLTKAGFKATLSFAVASEARIDDILEGKYDNLRASPTEAPMKEFRLPWEDQG